MADVRKVEVEVDDRPTSQKDLEARLAADFKPETPNNTTNDVLNPEKVYAPYAVDGNDTSGYIGVSPEYMTYAGIGDKPIKATEGPEADSLELLQAGVANVRKTVVEPGKAGEPGIVSTETIYTATSGEDYSARLVDAPADHFGLPVIGLPEQEEVPSPASSEKPKAEQAEKPSTPASPAAASKPATPAKK